MHNSHFLLAYVFGVLEGEAQDALARFFGDEFDGLYNTIDYDVLDTGIFAFGIFPYEYRVDVVVGSFVASDGFAGAYVGKEIEGTAEGEIK